MAYTADASGRPQSWGTQPAAPSAAQVPPVHPYPVPPQIVYLQSPTPHMHQHAAPQSVEKLTVPLLLFVSAVGFIGWASWFGTTSINSIQSSIKDISTTLTNYITVSTERVDRIEQVLEKRTAERWTKTDQQLFCAKTEALPGNKGWRCADADNGYMRLDGPPIWDTARDPAPPSRPLGFENPADQKWTGEIKKEPR